METEIKAIIKELSEAKEYANDLMMVSGKINEKTKNYRKILNEMADTSEREDHLTNIINEIKGFGIEVRSTAKSINLSCERADKGLLDLKRME